MATPSRSWVWGHFSKLPDNPKSVVCTDCDKHLSYHGGTTNLSNHLNQVHGLQNPGNPTTPQRRMDGFIKARRNLSADRSAEITKKIAEFIAKDMRPLGIVEVGKHSNFLVI